MVLERGAGVDRLLAREDAATVVPGENHLPGLASRLIREVARDRRGRPAPRSNASDAVDVVLGDRQIRTIDRRQPAETPGERDRLMSGVTSTSPCPPQARWLLRLKFGRGRWRKMKGVAEIELESGEVRTAEAHWYEAHGVGRRKMKIKRLMD